MRALSNADRVEMVSIWMATIAFFFMVVIAAVMIYLVNHLHRLNRDVIELQDQIDALRESNETAGAVS